MFGEVKLLAGLGLFAALLFGYQLQMHKAKVAGAAECQAIHAAEALKLHEAARDREAQWQADAQAIDEVRSDERHKSDAALAAALAGLRERPERAAGHLPAASQPASAGATGADLSRPDAEFLVGDAARADQLRADVASCEAWIEAVRRQQPK